jgi:uncharacterized protein
MLTSFSPYIWKMKSGFKRLILSGLVCIFIALLVFATKENPGNKYAATFADSCGISFPASRGYTNDFIHLFSKSELLQLDSMIGQNEKETGNQIAIITVDSAMTGTCNLEEYCQKIGKYWGVGQKDKNNGVIIGIAPALRKVTIQNGYGIESKMTDGETKIIIDRIFVPSFKAAKYFEGTRNGLLAIFDQIR